MRNLIRLILRNIRLNASNSTKELSGSFFTDYYTLTTHLSVVLLSIRYFSKTNCSVMCVRKTKDEMLHKDKFQIM